MRSRKKYPAIKNILIISTSWLGDSILTLPSLYGVRSLYPDAHISILAKDTIADLFRAVSAIDEIIPFSKNNGFKKLINEVKISRHLKRKNYDMAIILPNSFGSALIAFLAKTPIRVGFDTNFRGILLTERVKKDSSIHCMHQMHYYKMIVSPLGETVFPEFPGLFIPEKEKAWARNFFVAKSKCSSKFTVGFNPGSTYGEAKQWLPERFIELARRLTCHYDAQIIIFGDAKTKTIAQKIISAANPKIIDASARTSILQMCALLQRCDLLVTNDTGPMHAACAVGIPVVAIFGPTDPEATSPLGLNSTIIRRNTPCSPCLKRTCPEGHHRCMREITVQDVESAVFRQLQQISKNSQMISAR